MRLRGTRLIVVTALTATLAACGDDPFQVNWELAPDTALLYSLARPELNLPSAFNLNRRQFVQIESPGATGSWDFAVDTDADTDQLVFLTPGAIGLESRARITSVTGVGWDEVRKAPADTASYVGDLPVPIELGPIYIIQTGEAVGAFGSRCVYYGKVEALEVDPVLGTVRFQYDSNPVCNNRDLVPPRD